MTVSAAHLHGVGSNSSTRLQPARSTVSLGVTRVQELVLLSEPHLAILRKSNRVCSSTRHTYQLETACFSHLSICQSIYSPPLNKWKIFSALIIKSFTGCGYFFFYPDVIAYIELLYIKLLILGCSQTRPLHCCCPFHPQIKTYCFCLNTTRRQFLPDS